MLFTVFLLLGSQVSFSGNKIDAPGCASSRVFTIDQKDEKFCHLKTYDAWISADCVKNTAAPSCKAYIILKEMKTAGKIPPQDLRGGKNPGSVLCKAFGGQVVITELKSGDQISLCQASDHTWVDNNAIHNAWIQGQPK